MKKNSNNIEDIPLTYELEKIMALESPLERMMVIAGDKYTALIILQLHENPKQRFVEIERGIKGISPRTLSARLKHLERYLLVERKQYPTIPPRVEYKLTERGKEFYPILKEMDKWADKYYPYRPEK